MQKNNLFGQSQRKWKSLEKLKKKTFDGLIDNKETIVKHSKLPLIINKSVTSQGVTSQGVNFQGFNSQGVNSQGVTFSIFNVCILRK